MSGGGHVRGRGRGSRARAASMRVTTSPCRGRGRGRGPRIADRGMLPMSVRAGRPLQAQDTDQLVAWLSLPSSSSSSSSSLARGESSSTAAGLQVAPARQPAIPAVALPTCTEESAELFQHSVGELVLQDAQPFIVSEEEDTVVEPIGTDVVPAVAAHCQVGSSDDEEDDDEVLDRTWAPSRGEEVEEEWEEPPVAKRAVGAGLKRGGGRKRPTDHTSGTTPAAEATPSRPNSLVWPFFTCSVADPTVAICNLCLYQVKRGHNVLRLGTTCLKRHMVRHHGARWQQHLGQQKATPGALPPPPPTAPSASRSRSRDTSSTRHAVPRAHLGTDDVVALSVPGPSSSAGSSSSTTTQMSLPQLFQRKRMLSPSHPQAQRLTASLSKLLALQMLPFQLVESAAFKEFVQCAVPQWQIPSRHYFARKAIPALHRHVEGNVLTSLDHAVSSKVHLTTDTWSSKFGQGRYLSFTAHWVTLHADAKYGGQGSAALELAVPPRLRTAAAADTSANVAYSTLASSSSSSSSSISSSLPSSAGAQSHPSTVSHSYAATKAKRCHAVLQLVCLGDKSHTGVEILGAINSQAQRWFSPRQLEPGMVVCDNGTNLLAALRQGKLTHVPCLAHVLNLVVQRFLDRYPGLPDLLKQARRVCSHFRRSYSATVRLSELQREFHLPINRLICDMPTRWNSTLAMLRRLHTQQRAINEYLCDYGTRTGSAVLGFFSPRQWLLVQDACTVLSPFEEATRMVSQDSACISDTVPLVYMLERTLRGIMERALEAEHREDFLESQGPLYREHVPVVFPEPQVEEEEDQEEALFEGTPEHPEILGSGAAEPDPASLVRGWEESVPDPVQLSDPEDLGSSASTNLRLMGSLMLKSLRKDPRICAIKERDHYWLATLLDPRYKGKFAELMIPSQRHSRTRHFEDVLVTCLARAFPDTNRSQQQVGANTSAMSERSGVGQGGCLTDAFANFFGPRQPTLPSANSHRQRLRNMVRDYMGARADLETLNSADPLSYWVMRLEHWPELAQYALELLACPAASVLSERAFSAAGGFVTDSRVRLSTDSVDRLTFIKMNESWLSKTYLGPEADATD